MTRRLAASPPRDYHPPAKMPPPCQAAPYVAPPLPRHPRLLQGRADPTPRPRRQDEERGVQGTPARGEDPGDDLRQELHPPPGLLRGRDVPARRARPLSVEPRHPAR